jgi:hypothetical protein
MKNQTPLNPKTQKPFKNKTTAIMYHLKHIGRLSQKQATDLYGATRLSGLIFSKKEQGYDIKTHLIPNTKDRFNNVVPEYAEYELISEPSTPKKRKSKKIVHQLYSEEEMLKMETEDTPNTYDDFLDHWRELNEKKEAEENKGLWKRITKFFNG